MTLSCTFRRCGWRWAAGQGWREANMARLSCVCDINAGIWGVFDTAVSSHNAMISIGSAMAAHQRHDRYLSTLAVGKLLAYLDSSKH